MQAIRSSPYAAALGASQDRTPDVEVLGEQLARMRHGLPAHQQRLGTSDLKAVARANGQVIKARETAGMYRTMTTEVKAEQNLRRRLVDKHPTLHQCEQQARQELQRRAVARVVHQAPAVGQDSQQRNVRYPSR